VSDISLRDIRACGEPRLGQPPFSPQPLDESSELSGHRG
jgi:hypothetical protein